MRAERELISAIRAKCLDCCTGSSKMAATCNIESCPLWPYRPEMPKRCTGKTKQNVQMRIEMVFEVKKGK